MSRVTTDDRALAMALLDAAEAYVEPRSRKELRQAAVETIAKTIADIHERAVACAIVREFAVRARKEKR